MILRTREGISKMQMAKDLYTTRQVIRRWETGEQPLKLDDAVRVADYFGVSLEWLAGRNRKNEKNRTLDPEQKIKLLCERIRGARKQ